MSTTWDALAVYNSECARGLVHTATYDAQMVALQMRFETEMRQRWTNEGAVVGRPPPDFSWVEFEENEDV